MPNINDIVMNIRSKFIDAGTKKARKSMSQLNKNFVKLGKASSGAMPLSLSPKLREMSDAMGLTSNQMSSLNENLAAGNMNMGQIKGVLGSMKGDTKKLKGALGKLDMQGGKITKRMAGTADQFRELGQNINAPYDSLRGLEAASERTGRGMQELNNYASKNNKVIRKNGKVFDKNTGRMMDYKDVSRKTKKETKSFRFEFLSLMFAGMQMKKTFMGLLKPAMKTAGIMKVWGTILKILFLPVALALLDPLLSLLDWVGKMNKGTKKIIGTIVLLGAVFGTLLMVIGQAMLAFQGFTMLGGNMLWLLGGLAAVAALAVGSLMELGPASNKAGEDFRMLGFGLGSVVGMLKEKLPNAMSKLWSIITGKLPGWISKAWSVAKSLVGGLVVWLRDVFWPNLVSAFGQLWSFITQTLPTWITKAWSKAKSVMGSLWKWLKTVFWPNFVQALKTLWNYVTQRLPAWIAKAWKKAKSLMGTLWEWLKNTFWPKFVDIIRNLWDYLRKKLPGWVRKAWNIIKDSAKELYEYLKDNLPDWATKAWEKLRTVVPKVWRKYIKPFLKSLPGKIKNLLMNIIPAFSDIISALGNKIGQAADTLGGMDFREIGSNFANSIVDGFSNLPEAISNIGGKASEEGLFGAFARLARNIFRLLGKIQMAILNFIIGFGSEIGIALIEAIWKGISGMAGWFWDKLTGFISDMKDKLMPPYSPFPKSAGTEVISMFSQGMEENMMMPKDRAVEAVNGVREGLSGITNPKIEAPDTGSGRNVSNKNINFNPDVTVNVDASSEVDIDEIRDRLTDEWVDQLDGMIRR